MIKKQLRIHAVNLPRVPELTAGFTRFTSALCPSAEAGPFTAAPAAFLLSPLALLSNGLKRSLFFFFFFTLSHPTFFFLVSQSLHWKSNCPNFVQQRKRHVHAGPFDQRQPRKTNKQSNKNSAAARLVEAQIKTVSNQSGQK